MRLSFVCALTVLVMTTAPLPAAERPLVKSSEATQHASKAATVYGRVIEVRRIAGGPIIFEIDGQPSAPVFRALVYPMSAARFGSDPENRYLGQDVEITGVITVRNGLPQAWLSDPSHIRLHKVEKPPTPAESKN